MIFKSNDEKSLLSQFDGLSKDNKIIRNQFIPILTYLDSAELTLNKIPNFSNLLRSYSLKNKKNSKSDSSKMINKKDFAKIFRFLYEKTKDKNYIFERSLNRINYTQRDILFAYFSLKYEKVMHEIANNYFSCLDFHFKIYDKVELSLQWHKYIDDLNTFKNQEIKNNALLINTDNLKEKQCKNRINETYSIANLIWLPNEIDNLLESKQSNNKSLLY